MSRHFEAREEPFNCSLAQMLLHDGKEFFNDAGDDEELRAKEHSFPSVFIAALELGRTRYPVNGRQPWWRAVDETVANLADENPASA